MVRSLLCAMMLLVGLSAFSQAFEISNLQESYRGAVGETIKAPLYFKNTSEKPITLIIRKVNDDIRSTQKTYFCLDNNCLDQRIHDFSVRIEPGQTLTNFHVALEGGLVEGVNSLIKYIAYSKLNPGQSIELDLNFSVEPERASTIYSSRYITLTNVYPNPVIDDFVSVAYKVQSDQIKAKIVIHNILGNLVAESELPPLDNVVKIKADNLSAGIYFYTLYINNEGVVTRKLIVKK
jgi:hypothetical protein